MQKAILRSFFAIAIEFEIGQKLVISNPEFYIEETIFFHGLDEGQVTTRWKRLGLQKRVPDGIKRKIFALQKIVSGILFCLFICYQLSFFSFYNKEATKLGENGEICQAIYHSYESVISCAMKT